MIGLANQYKCNTYVLIDSLVVFDMKFLNYGSNTQNRLENYHNYYIVVITIPLYAIVSKSD